ncbi:MAG: PKD domain-containing protein, partial [Bacteroidales bacterium]|nr:PKD domain-containing protein [Bacteroidales bacterium]
NVADGTATVTPTGTAPFSYHWSNNGNTATISGLAGGNYSVTVTDGNGCVSTAIVNVATMDTPPVADFLVNNAENVAICLGAEVAFTDLSTNTPTQWAWNFGDGQTSNVQNPTHTYASAGNYTVSLTVTNQDGSDTKQITNCVVVNAVPTAIATNSGAYCAGETIELSVESDIAGEYQWTGPMGYNSTLQNPTRANATANHVGTYSVTVTTANGCSAVASTDVIVIANPVASITNNSGTTTLTCSTTSIELVANGGTSYSWNNGVANTAEFTASAAGDYTVVVTNEGNCTAEASVTITADGDVPTISIDGATAYCEGASISLSASSNVPVTYTWTGPNGYTASTATINIPNATADNAGIYSASVVAANGCEASSTVTVVVNANPTVEVSSNSPVCEGGDVTFTASSTETLSYSWSGPNGFASTDASPVISGAILANAGNYTLAVENAATGCGNTFHTELMVNAAPTVSLGDDVTVCANVEATLNATAGFVSYTWNGVAGSQSFTATEAGDYTVVVADNNGCTASNVVMVSHYELPELAMSSTPESGHGVADGTASVEISGGTAPYAILWNNNETTAQITGLTNGHYTVVVTDDNGCAVNGAVDVNSLNTPPVAAFTADVESGCAPLTVNFTDNSSNFPQTWTWDFDGTTSSEQNPSHIFSEPGTYNVSLTVSNLDGSDIATKVITVYANPTVIVPEINQSIICEGSSSEITVWNDANISYEWSNGSTESTTVVTEAGVYTLTITDEHGCSATAAFEMTMAPVPEISLGADDIDVCENSEAEINAGDGYNWYNWSTGEMTQSIMVSAAGEYSVTVFNEYGCEASDTIAVSILAAPTFAISDTSVCVNEEIVLSVETDDEVLWFGETEGNTYAQTYPYAGEYLVWVTVSNGECETTDTITVTVETCTSVDEMSAM